MIPAQEASSDQVVGTGILKPGREFKRKVSAGAGKDYLRADMGAEAIHRGDQPFPSCLCSG